MYDVVKLANGTGWYIYDWINMKDMCPGIIFDSRYVAIKYCDRKGWKVMGTTH